MANSKGRICYVETKDILCDKCIKTAAELIYDYEKNGIDINTEDKLMKEFCRRVIKARK